MTEAAWGCKMVKYRYLLALMLIGGWVSIDGVFGLIATAQAQTPKDDLAAQIRIQGIVCGKALAARREATRSRPDYQVWILKCDNATYRVSRYPDMAAKVEQLR